MKNLYFAILLIVTLIFISTTSSVYAQNTTPATTNVPTISSSQKNESLVQQINELKDKIASRVAQLNLVEKRGVVGTVTESSDTRITLKTYSGEVKIIGVDEITKFSSPSAKGTFGISDVNPGSIISAIGLYNKQSKHVLARFVTSYTLPVFLHGKISEIDKDEFTITVPTKDTKKMVIDIETTTRVNGFANGKIARVGFTKLNIGDLIDVVGYPDEDDRNKMSATYLLQITNPTPIESPTP